ncbi:MAG: 50S ribosomal protein L35 [Candidatus Paceibacteria bacterium]
MKTKKIFTKRLKTTKKGKVLARVPGQNHFNAKESSRGRMKRRRVVSFGMTNRVKSRQLSK